MTNSAIKKAKAPNGPAYLLSFSLENVRCFGPKQTLDLSDGKGRPAQWTVLLGNNGVGKTSLLQAITKLASVPVYGGDMFYSAQRPSTHSRDVMALCRKGALSARVYSEVVVGGELRSMRAGKSIPIEYRDAVFLSELEVAKRQLLCGQIFGYGALRRSGKTASLRAEFDDSAYWSLFSENAELVNPDEWLLQLDYAASKYNGAKNSPERKRFDLVRNILIDILPDVKGIDIRHPLPGEILPSVTFDTPDGDIDYRALGLGYRTMITWMVDLAARMIRRYPDSLNPIAEPAIVLIDEIDLHLHPSWQRKLIRYLSERFVNTQFIVTAHSPLVVQAASDANIAVLRRESDHVVIDQRPRSIQGWRVDQLLTSDLFDLPSARAERYDALMKERTQLLSQARLSDKDRARLAELEAEIEGLPTGETPADIEAMSIIHRAARLLKAKDAERAA